MTILLIWFNFTNYYYKSFSSSDFYGPLKSIVAKTDFFHSSLIFVNSSAFLNPNILRSLFNLPIFFLVVFWVSSCLVFTLTLTCPISPFDLQTCLIQRIHILFRVPTVLDLLYSSSKFSLFRILYFPSLFLFEPDIFLNIFLLNTFIFFFICFCRDPSAICIQSHWLDLTFIQYCFWSFWQNKNYYYCYNYWKTNPLHYSNDILVYWIRILIFFFFCRKLLS